MTAFCCLTLFAGSTLQAQIKEAECNSSVKTKSEINYKVQGKEKKKKLENESVIEIASTGRNGPHIPKKIGKASVAVCSHLQQEHMIFLVETDTDFRSNS